MKLLLLQFNNYFNRIIKKYSTVEDYISHSSNSDYANPSDTNFKPYDQIATEHIINWAKKWSPDYLICIDEENANNIVGRWFITESVRTRKGQFKLSLKRDVIAEKLDLIVHSPCFVQKGYVNKDNPLIFNKEEFDCNQIKKQECLLKDTSLLSWIVIYYNKSKKSSLSGSFSVSQAEYIDTGVNALDEWDFWNSTHEGYESPRVGEKGFDIYVDSSGTTAETVVHFGSEVNFLLAWRYEYSSTELEYNKGFDETVEAVKSNIASNKASIKYHLDLEGEPSITFENLMKHNGKIYKVGAKYYEVVISSNGYRLRKEYLTTGSLYNAITDAFKTGGQFKTGWSGSFDDAIELNILYDVFRVQFIERGDIGTTYNYNFTSVRDLKDAPYGIICLPYKDDPIAPFGCENGDYRISVLLAQELCKSGIGQDKPIYDVQILPYCPMNLGAGKRATGEVYLYYLTDLQNNDYVWIKDGNNANILIALIPEYATFSKKIDVRVTMNITSQMYFLNNGSGKKDYKLENQLVFYRFVSPNYNGQFEFNRAKNGDFDTVDIDCCYKPYQPYIHVAPLFNRLYGSDFNDARGLICGGDFSMSIVTSAWETYKLQNKNFQDIFNRGIQSMDTMHKYGMIEQGINAFAGTTQGAMSGFVMSGGNPVGAVGGGILSGAGGIGDLILSQKKFAEQRDLTIDLHNYQLGNIKALPNSLAKVDAFNNNNKLFPFIERYCCTDEEIAIFEEKLKYEGMTINANGRLIDYINTQEDMTFVKGQLIRLDGLNEESHFAYEIYNEISKGVYIYGYSEFNQ